MDKHDTLLLACGTPETRACLRAALESRYNLLEALNSRQLMLLLGQNISCIAAVVLDITDGDKIDRQLLESGESRELLHRLPVIVITGDSADAVSLAFSLGAADVIPLGYDAYALQRRIENIVQLHLHKRHLETMVAEQASLLRHSNENMVDVLSSIIEYRSVESGQHIRRIRHFTRVLLEEVAQCCPEYRLTDRAIAIISSASALHDIGKIAIPDAVLMKPGPLTDQEREIMKTHAITGCRILETLRDMSDPEYLRYAYNICRYHHERWDGRGYPEGLAGDSIPICAQVVGLADVYDALTTKRVYKDAYSFSKAVNMILRGDCGVFSPKLLECFKHVAGQYEELSRRHADAQTPDGTGLDMTLPAPEKEQWDSLEHSQGKYYALAHYIGALVMEVDLERDMLHLIYNPYPELAWFQSISSLEELSRVLYGRMASARQQTKDFDGEIREFIHREQRRLSRRIRFSGEKTPEDEFEITLLRTGSGEVFRRTVLLLCRRISGSPRENIPSGNETYMKSSVRCLWDRDFTLVSLGDHIPQMALYSPRELHTHFGGKLIEMVLPEDREKMRRTFRECLQTGTSGEAEYRVRSRDGQIIWVRNTFYLRSAADGTEYLDCFLADVTAGRAEMDAMAQKLEKYEIILAQTENVLFEWDCVTDTFSLSDAWKEVFGLPPFEGGFRQTLETGAGVHPDDLPRIVDMMGALENGSAYEMTEVRIATDKGRYLWCRVRSSALRGQDGSLEKVSGIIINVDAEKQAQRDLQDRARRDSLTGLLNKHAARMQAEEYIKRIPQGMGCALLILDLDDFKHINDHYGHLFGDAVLTRIARETEKQFRSQDIVARIGGDEFLVLMRGTTSRELLEKRCRELLDAIRDCMGDRQIRLKLSCSVGIARYPEDGSTYVDLFTRADEALYLAKDKGKNCFAFYETGADRKAPALTRTDKPIDSEEEPGLAADSIVRYAFQKLYTARNVEQSIHEILTLVGKKINVSRVYVFENSDDDRFCSNTYEWCNEGIRPEIGNLQNISYREDIPGYLECYDENGILYCPDIQLLKPEIRGILEPQGIKSLLHCAIREDGRFRGYIGFDECVEHRLWTREEINTLTFFSEALSMFLLRLRRQEKVQRQADELTSILDNQDAWISIVDPKDYTLRYANARLKKNLPGVKTGVPCYRTLGGKDAPCEHCPARKLEGRKNATCVRRDPRLGRSVLMEATSIRWEGKEALLMTSRVLPETGDPENNVPCQM